MDNSYLTEKTKLKVINKKKQTIRVNNPSFNKICREKQPINDMKSSSPFLDHITVTPSLTSESEMQVFEDS